jgi:hypothetical protein
MLPEHCEPPSLGIVQLQPPSSQLRLQGAILLAPDAITSRCSGHTEITLNGLRRKPEVIHANVRAFCPILDPVPDDHTGPCSIAEEIQLL